MESEHINAGQELFLDGQETLVGAWKKTLEKNSFALVLPDLVKTPDTIGIKAEFIAPSANNLLNKLGSLKATKNASDIKPAPITLAIRRSLA